MGRASMGRSPESYLVRIYRRDAQESGRVAGLVEIIEQERSETFKSAGELLRILGIDDCESAGRPEKKGR